MSAPEPGAPQPGAGEPDAGQLAPLDRAGRLPRLRERFDAAEIDGLLVTSLTNVAYLTGFTGSSATLLVTGDRVLLVTDGRYREQAAEQVDGARPGGGAKIEVEVEIGRPPAQLEALVAAVGDLARIGLESAHVSWARQRSLAEALAEAPASRGALVATTGVVEGLRLVKDAGELARMEAAAAIADAALESVRAMLGQGPTEAEVALALDHEMRRLGASASAFPTIVASGPNGAKPHARPSRRRIARGELVVIDFGAVVDGYCSDMTRTLCAGPPRSSVLAAMDEVVRASQAAGLEAVAAGVAAAEVDRACREVVAVAGWAEAFVHGTGHGVGLDIHEAPGVGPTSADTLVESSVVTVEPGVYLAGHGGVRIEDTVVITATGCRCLTRAPKDLVVP